jgi:hypothetical protein
MNREAWNHRHIYCGGHGFLGMLSRAFASPTKTSLSTRDDEVSSDRVCMALHHIMQRSI